MSRAYYNEHDPKAAAWLRELIKRGHIAPGDMVDSEGFVVARQPEEAAVILGIASFGVRGGLKW